MIVIVIFAIAWGAIGWGAAFLRKPPAREVVEVQKETVTACLLSDDQIDRITDAVREVVQHETPTVIQLT